MLGAVLRRMRIDVHPAHGIFGQRMWSVGRLGSLLPAAAIAVRVGMRVGERAAGSVRLIGHDGVLVGGTLI